MRTAKSEYYEAEVIAMEKEFRRTVAKLNVSEEEKETLRKLFTCYGAYSELFAEALNNEAKR